MKKPKLQDYIFRKDVTGEKAYTAYRKAKNEYVKAKKELINRIFKPKENEETNKEVDNES